MAAPAEIDSLLQAIWDKKKERSLEVVQFAPGVDLKECVNAALDFCSNLRTDWRSLRAIFCFSGADAARWVLEKEFRELERRCRYVAQGKAWDIAGIRRALGELGHQSETLARSVLDETGGWPVLLNELDYSSENVLRASIGALKTKLYESGEPLGGRFRDTLEIPGGSLAERILAVVSDERDGCERKELKEVVELEGTASDEEWNAALALLERVGCLCPASGNVKPTDAGCWCSFLFSNTAVGA